MLSIGKYIYIYKHAVHMWPVRRKKKHWSIPLCGWLWALVTKGLSCLTVVRLVNICEYLWNTCNTGNLRRS